MSIEAFDKWWVTEHNGLLIDGCYDDALKIWLACADEKDKELAALQAAWAIVSEERNNAEKREYEVLGRANALEAELKAAQARLDASDELLREEFAQRQDALATLRDIGDFAHDRSTGPAVEDALWEVRRMAYAGLDARIEGIELVRPYCTEAAMTEVQKELRAKRAELGE